MPYYVHRKSVESRIPGTIGEYGWDYRDTDPPYEADADWTPFVPGDVLGDYYTREEAYRAMADAGTTDYMVSYRATPQERRAYEYRESDRFRRGAYLPVPWHGIEGNDGHAYYHHFAHLSIDTPGMVAYTPDHEHGYADRQIRLKPGKYLARFYGNVLTAEQIADYVARSNVAAVYQTTTDADEIEAVYLGGPSSCMSHRIGDYCTEIHPSRAYGDSPDLALAYFGDLHAASQRAIIWPSEKTYTRIYGTGPLRVLLERDGYTQSAPYGARIRKIVHSRHERQYVCPYIDHISRASEDGQYLVLDDEGPIAVQSTDGYASYCRDYDDERNDYRTCDHCGNEYDESQEGTDEYCQSCEDGRVSCDDCGDMFFTTHPHAEDFTDIDGIGQCCESCTSAHTSTCADEKCSHTWIEANEYTDEQTAERKRTDRADLCSDCADRYVYCEHCEAAYDPEDATRDNDPACPTCGRLPRCESTGDLLAVLDSPDAPDVPNVSPGTFTDAPASTFSYTLPNICTEIGPNVAF